MRFMLMVKASKESEAGQMPSEAMIMKMAKLNEEMVRAGVMLDGSGLHPSSRGWKVKFAGGKPTVVDGPFSEAKELVGGYWLIQTRTREEALEWARRVPFDEGEIEVRQLFEMTDFEPSPAVERQKKLSEALQAKK